jgi:hypothetical protein
MDTLGRQLDNNYTELQVLIPFDKEILLLGNYTKIYLQIYVYACIQSCLHCHCL